MKFKVNISQFPKLSSNSEPETKSDNIWQDMFKLDIMSLIKNHWNISMTFKIKISQFFE